jgi:hypothetical protein
MFRPMVFKIFKGKSGKFGSLNLSLSDAHFFKGREKDFNGSVALNGGKLVDGWDQREGCLFLEVASTTAPDVYDWANKIVMALSVTDMGKLLLTLATGVDCNIMHDPGAKSESAGQTKKYLKVTSPKGLLEGGVLLTVNQTKGEETKSVMVPVSPDEVMVLRSLVQSAISRVLAW